MEHHYLCHPHSQADTDYFLVVCLSTCLCVTVLIVAHLKHVTHGLPGTIWLPVQNQIDIQNTKSGDFPHEDRWTPSK